MPVLEIVEYPDSRLKQECQLVEEVSEETRTLLADMAETMYEAPGVGLAAPQIGILQRIIVVDPGPEDPDDEEAKGQLFKLINPEIVESAGKVDSEEGCLSIPGIRETIKRFERVVVEALDENGQEVTIEADGFLAIVLQHEIDHLDGILFIDHLSRLKQKLVKSKIKKLLEA
jgi:peptide deformylase